MPFGQPPDHLPEAVKQVWFELESYSLPGVLTAAERPMMELLATLLAQFRASPIDFPTPRAALIVSCLARLGMNPADRQKIVMPKEDAKPPAFAEFVQ